MYRLCCSTTWGIFSDQWSNQCPLPWQADSQPLDNQGSPVVCFSYLWHFCLKIFNHDILSSKISSGQWNPLGWQECLFLHCLIQWPLSLSGYWVFEIWLVKLKLFSSSSFSAIRVVSFEYLRLLIFLLAILIPAYASSSLAFCMMYSAYKLNKQGDNIQPWPTPFPVWSQSIDESERGEWKSWLKTKHSKN